MPALLAITVLAFASAPVAHAQPDITIETVPIGQPNNPADGSDFGHSGDNQVGYGSVSYAYNIGKSEVTNAQYAIFLNAVAQQSDPYGLYNTEMGSTDYGGITRSEVDGSYLYTVRDGRGDKPVNFVSFYDAARFCNWLTNGATTDPTSTETGMYTMSMGNSVTRNQDAWLAGGVAITSEDEWYKAAYYDLDTETYTTYATGNSISTDQANYSNSYYDTHGQTDSERIAPAGSYREEQNDTLDMMGNVWEWNEAITSFPYRGLRGGYYGYRDEILASSYRPLDGTSPSVGWVAVGFRVVTLGVVPEPGTYGILGGAAALLGAIALRRRSRRD